jgi:hypothetical protein
MAMHLMRLIDWMEVFFGMIWVAIAIFGFCFVLALGRRDGR